MTTHAYATSVTWSGSTGSGHHAYSRTHKASAPPVAVALALSADPAFRGEPTHLNPEQLLVMATSSCQLLSFLAVAAQHQVDVLRYDDAAQGFMDDRDEPARISRVVLSPTIAVAAGTDHDEVVRLAGVAHDGCYIANSLTTHVALHVTVVEA